MDKKTNPNPRLFSHIECSKLIENLPEAVFLEDFSGNILDANSEASKLLGYKKQELLNLTTDDIVPEGAPAFLPDQIDEATKLGKPLETTNIRKDGAKVPIELKGRIIEVGEVERILVSIRDISDRKAAKEKLHQERDLFQSIMTLTPDFVYFKDDQHKFEKVNDGYANLLGINKEDMIGKTAKDLWPEAKEILKDETRALNGEPVIGREREVTLPNGEKRWYSIQKFPRRDNEGNITGFLGMDRDITERKNAEKALAAKREKLRQLHNAVDRLQQQNSEQDVLQTAVDAAKNILDFESCAISIVEGDTIVPKANTSGLASDELTTFKIGEGLTGKSIERGETIWGEDVRSHPAAKPTNKEFRAFISTPIGKLGNFQVISKEVGSFGQTEVELTEILAGHLREEIKRVRLEEELRQKADSIQSTKDKLESLHKVARKLESADTQEEVFQLGINAAVETLDFLICSFAIAKDGKFEDMATSAESPSEWIHEDMSVDEGLTGKTYQTGETYLYDDIREVEEAKPARSEYRSFISTPIGDIGVFQVISEQVNAFTKEDAQLAELLTGHIYEVLQRVKLEKQLKEQAIHDPLTDLYNRRYFNETLNKEVEEAIRYNRPLAFLMIDIDDFKRINDQYSHQTGDKILQQVARLIQENVRSADTVVRFGGDEFLVMMPETNGESEIIPRLKKELSRWNEESNLLQHDLTLAMGISHWTAEQNRDIEKALTKADRNMYKDKQR